MQHKAYVIANREYIMKKLMEVSDLPHYQEHLYPLLVTQAGKRSLTTEWIMLAVVDAVDKYAKGMSKKKKRAVRLLAEEFVGALLEDPNLAAEAKELMKRRNQEDGIT